MRPYLITFACLCSVLAFVTAVPVPASNQELDVLQIPLSNGKELDVLTLGAKDQEQIVAERNKRTIGLLRELFPDITKQIDGIVNRIIAQVIRVAGPDVLRSLLGNNNRNATPRPNLAADFDDDDEDEDDNDINKLDNNSKSTTATSKINGDDDDDNSRVQIDLPTFPPASSEDGGANKNGATDTQIDLSAINKQLEETIRVARQVKEAEAAAQVVAALQQQQPAQLPIPTPKIEETIQLSFNNELNSLTSNEKPKSISNDLQLSESKSPAIDELTLDSNEDTTDLDDRNKRFLQFGGGGLAGGSSGGSSSGSGGAGGAGAGGSGNFLFDVVRLFSGSVQTQAGDESANSANSVSSSSDSDSDSDSNRSNDGYTEGIPGPVTRLVVLANRGLANLVQDLILRVAATSEKFVNFKAKLITALI